MNLENLDVQELNTEDQKETNGGRNVEIGECNGGAFNDNHDEGFPWMDYWRGLTGM